MNKKLRILLIEDNPGDARLIEEMLKESGVQSEIECVDRLSAGIGQVKLDGFDVILLDLGLPDSQGLSTLSKLNDIRPEAPVIVLTGLADDATGMQAIKEGAQDYLIKGQIDHHLLSRSIKYAIGRRKAEDLMVASEKKYRVLVETMNEGLGIQDKNGIITYMNKRACEMFGYKSEELTGRPIDILFDKEGLKSFKAQMALRHLGKEENYEIVWRRKDGSSVPTIVSPHIIYDAQGNFDGSFGVFIDITERKKAEEALRESEERFKLIFESSTDGILLAGLEEKKFFAGNKKICELIGYTPDEIKGLGVTDIHPEKDLPYVIEQFNKQAKREIEIAADIPVKRKDGSIFYADINSFPIKLGGKNYLVGSFRDITERKLADQERERLNKELEQILYAASHDLKTPLVNINGYTGEVKKSIENIIGLAERGVVSSEIRKEITSLAKELPEWFKFISSSVSRMDMLLNGLLQFSRSGSVDLKIEEIDMNALINEIAGNLNYRLKDADAILEVADLPRCGGDREQLNRIFSNLMENAVKYLDPARKGEIRVTGYKEENSSVYCVEDNGIGIAAEHQKQIFHIFHQLDPSITGEGLGLAIVQRMVERHGGKIWLESEKGKGCRFCVALPRKQ